MSRLRGVLRHLGAPDLVIHGAQEVPAEFDARFSAVWRRYSYRIADDEALRDPLAAQHTVVHRGTLDHDAMAGAAYEVLGLHDFLPFCKPRPESTTIRTLLDLAVVREDSGSLRWTCARMRSATTWCVRWWADWCVWDPVRGA